MCVWCFPVEKAWSKETSRSWKLSTPVENCGELGLCVWGSLVCFGVTNE